MTINGRALTAISVGTLFVWSGIKGWSVLGSIGDIVSGSQPKNQATTPLTVDTVPGTTQGGIGTNAIHSSDSLANVALQYKEHCYRFGGAPGRNAENCWDCSSFVNYVASVKLGRAIPGYGPGKYTGTAHGPATGQWLLWNGIHTVKRSETQAGDIVLFPGHMGIAISPDTMISALNPRSRTQVTRIDGISKPVLRVARYA